MSPLWRGPRPFLCRLVLALLLVHPAAAYAQSKYWTDLDGHRYDATIVSFYEEKELVTFRHIDGRTFTLALNDLVPNDREAVRSWLLNQPDGAGGEPPPTQMLSPYGRSFVLDEPRVLRLRPLQDHGYLSAYLGIPLTVRNNRNGVLDYVNVYFYDDQHKRIQPPFPNIPRGSPLMIQDGKTTAFVKPAALAAGQTYMVLIPIRDPAARMAAYAVVIAGNGPQNAITVFPNGSWRDFDFPERPLLTNDKYADYSGQELYARNKPSELFDILNVTRWQANAGDRTPERDYFRLTLRIDQPFPASALSARWYAFDKDQKLLPHAEDTPPYAQADRKDGMFILNLYGQGSAALTSAVMPTKSDAPDTVQLPGAAWWDKPEVETLVFVFGTETKKVAKVFSKSGVELKDLPVPEKESFGGASPTTLPIIPLRSY